MEEIIEVGPTDPLWRRAFEEVLAASSPPWAGPPDFAALSNAMREVGSTFVLTIDGKPVGVAMGEWYPEPARVLVYSFLAIIPAARSHGIGARLHRHAIEVWGKRHRPCAILGEVELPGVNPPSPDHGDPIARIRFHSRHGARALDLPYFQPTVDGTRKLNSEMLIVFDMDPIFAGRQPDTFAPGPLAAFIEDYLRRAEGGQIGTDRATTALLAAARNPEGIRLIVMDDKGLKYLASRKRRRLRGFPIFW